MLTGFECVHRTAVRTLCLASARHVQVNLGVAAVQIHMRLGAGQYTPPWAFRSDASNSMRDEVVIVFRLSLATTHIWGCGH